MDHQGLERPTLDSFYTDWYLQLSVLALPVLKRHSEQSSTALILRTPKRVSGSQCTVEGSKRWWQKGSLQVLKKLKIKFQRCTNLTKHHFLQTRHNQHKSLPVKSHGTVDNTSQVTKMSASDEPQLQHTADTSVHTKIQPPSTVAAQKIKTDLPRMQALELPETSDILQLMKTFSTSKQPLRAHWMHFIDTGGQPQFLEILPAFIRNVSLLLLLVKLSEELSDTPTVEYFSPDGKSYQLGVFPLSNEQLLLQAAQLSLFHQSQISLPHNIIEKEQSQPNMTVVGTFADQESKCKETRSEKNNRLKTASSSLSKSSWFLDQNLRSSFLSMQSRPVKVRTKILLQLSCEEWFRN